MSAKNKNIFLIVALVVLVCGIFIYYLFFSKKVVYMSDNVLQTGEQPKEQSGDFVLGAVAGENILNSEEVAKALPEIEVTHINTPESVKALYVSAWVAGSAKYINPLVDLIDKTELNAIVIDIKDSTGRVSFHTDNYILEQLGSSENRISDIKSLIDRLHKKNIYVIGRISVFQDPYLTKLKSEWAITKKSDGGIWKDRKGLSFLDPTKKEVHDYIITLAKESYNVGFDEINFDYIRYPSDGNISDINYRLTEGKTRADNIESFFKYLSEELKKENIVISADLFGLTTEGKDDMGIGQVWERALPYFDYLCPMVYPSHYPSGYMGYKNPALFPYEVVDKALASAVVKNNTASQNIAKIRPWLQDFDLGATYTKDLIRAQIRAVYDNKLGSWMLWDPANKYTPDALLLESGE